MSDGAGVKSWVTYPRANPRAHLRLFCFPYAGGGATIFRGWPKLLPPEVELCAVQYRGRGSRLREPLAEGVREHADSIAEDLFANLNKPFAFFGHSMGALVSFELARRLQREGRPGPLQLFVSGCAGPRVPTLETRTYDLPDAEFIEELRRLKGTPAEVLDNSELMQLMLPVIRADFKASQTYTYTPGTPLKSPVTAFGGLSDEMVTREKLEAWGEVTSSAFNVQMFPGDHFFLHPSEALLTRVIAQKLFARARRDSGHASA